MRARAKDRVEYAVLQEEFSSEQLDELIALIVEMGPAIAYGNWDIDFTDMEIGDAG